MSVPFRPCVANMPGYVPGKQPPAGARVIKLNTNENPYAPSPRVADAIRAELDAGERPGARLCLYPDPSAAAVREAAASVTGFDAKRIIVGNGSDELLVVLLRAFVGEGDAVAFPYPTYVLYETLANLHGAEVRKVDFGADFALPAALAETGARLTFVASPNSPTGNRFTTDELRSLARRLDGGVLVVDEAYAGFADDNALALANTEPNVVVLRTLSKSHGMAGMRVGLLFGSAEMIEGLGKVRDSYSVDRLAVVGAAAALRDQAWTDDAIGRIRATRARLVDALSGMGLEPLPSESNFVFVRMGSAGSAADAHAFLEQRGILVRYFPMRMLDDGLRITVGTDEEVDALLAALSEWMG